METQNKGRLFVFSGPSGVGKGTMLAQVLAAVPNVTASISATTRAPRPGENHGVHYFFLSVTDFEDGIANGDFLEHARYGDNYYGTPRNFVLLQRNKGFDVFLEIEVQGAHIVKEKMPDAILIYVQPPSLEILEQRLRDRGTETEEKIRQRLAIAESEQEQIPTYDYLITNDALETAVRALTSIVIAERHRIRHE